MKRKFLKHEDLNYTKNPNVRSWYLGCPDSIISVSYTHLTLPTIA